MPLIELEPDTQEHVGTVQRLFADPTEFSFAPGTDWIYEKDRGAFVLNHYTPSHIFPPPENLSVKFRFLSNEYSDDRLRISVIQTVHELKEDPDATGEINRQILETCCLNLVTGEIDGYPEEKQFVLTEDGIYEILQSFVDFAHNPLAALS